MFRAAVQLFTGSLLGKILAVVREVVLAALFGATAPTAAYRVAQTATLVPINFATADTLSAGFLPHHRQLREAAHHDAVVYYRCVRDLVMALAVVVTLVLGLASRQWTHLLAPGFTGDLSTLTSSMLLIMAIGVPFYVYATLASYLAMSFEDYRIASIRSSVQSIGLLSSTLIAFFLHAPTVLAWGFTAAYVGLSIWAFFRVRHRKYATSHVSISFTERVHVYGTFWRIIRPLLGLPILLQGSIVVERALSTLISAAATAALDYARIFTDTIVLLLATPLGLGSLSSLPHLSREELNRTVAPYLRLLVLLSVAISSGFALFGNTMISLVLKRGAFNQNALEATDSYLLGLSVGLWAQCTAYLLTKVLNAQKRNLLASITVAAGCTSTIICDLVLYRPLGPLGLGLGASVGAFAQLVVAVVMLGFAPLMLKLAGVLSPVVAISAVGAILLLHCFTSPVPAIAFWVAAWCLYIFSVGSLRSDATRALRHLQLRTRG